MSEASTIPATEEQLAAARKLPRPSSVADSGLSTPQDKILRRQNTQVLPGHIGDIHLLATAAAKQQPVEVSKKGKVKSKPARSVKKKQPKNAKQGKRGKKTSGVKKAVIKKQKTQKETMPTAPTEKAPAKGAPSQQPGSAATAPQPNHLEAPATAPAPRPACKKAAAKKPVVPPAQPVKVEPKSERIRRKNEVQTPPSVREAHGVAQAQLDNMGRSTTYEQFMSPVPSTQNDTNKEPSNHDDDEHLSDATSYYEPSEQEEEEEDADEKESELEESESENEPGQPDESNAAPTPTPTQKGKGKKAKKPKTPEQKAAHARYMKFSRSLRSTFAAA